jgi:GNAT superfamily N-acetyltransferase
MSPVVHLRDMREEDIYFIHSSWLRSLRNDSPLNSKIPTGIWNHGKSPEIKEMIASAQIKVAHLPEDDTHLVGFIAFEKFGEVLIIHYLLVKSIYQGFGFSRTLLNEVTQNDHQRMIVLSCLSKDFVLRFFNRDKKNCLYVYNPFILKEIGYGGSKKAV